MNNSVKNEEMLKRILHQFFFVGLLISFVVFAPHLLLAQQKVAIIEHLHTPIAGMGTITIEQDSRIAQLLNDYYIQNISKPGMSGFRIRIFFDLGQQSRTKSQEAMDEFMEKFPGVSVYRTYDSPYYKVSVGDFRTRDEALKMLKSLETSYPKAFIIAEWINFPLLD
jgi:hypothetical protein